MNDGHYHDVSEVNGAARDGHSHSPRDLGAAEEHELEMHLRDYQALAHTVSQLQGLSARDAAEFRQGITSLERRAAEQDRRIASLERSVAEWAQAHRDLQGQLLELATQVSQVTKTLARAIEQRRL